MGNRVDIQTNQISLWLSQREFSDYLGKANHDCHPSHDCLDSSVPTSGDLKSHSCETKRDALSAWPALAKLPVVSIADSPLLELPEHTLIELFHPVSLSLCSRNLCLRHHSHNCSNMKIYFFVGQSGKQKQLFEWKALQLYSSGIRMSIS